MVRSEYYGTNNRTPSHRRECTFGIKTININGAVSRRGGQGGRVGYKINSRMFGEDIFAIVDTRLRGNRIDDLKRNIPYGSFFLASRMPIHVWRPWGVALYIPGRHIRSLINIT